MYSFDCLGLRRCVINGRMDECTKTETIPREDGELPDSEDDTLTGVSNIQSSLRLAAPPVFSYRVPQKECSSEGSDDSDAVSPCKKSRHTTCHSETRQPVTKPISQITGRGRRKNNVWGNVVEDDLLTQTITGVVVEKSDCIVDRDVESYGYMRSNISPVDHDPITDESEHETSKPDADLCDKESFGTNDSFKKTTGVKSRLGKRTISDRKRQSVKERVRTYDTTLTRDHIGVTVEDSANDVVEAIMRTLGEPEEKTEVFKRLVAAAGVKKTLELLYMTEDVESAGGMMIADGSRRRTAGGVFFTLLKSDPDLTKAQMDEIFAEERKIWKEKCRRKKQHTRRRMTPHRAEVEGQGGQQMDTNHDTKVTDEVTNLADCDDMLDDSVIEIELGVG